MNTYDKLSKISFLKKYSFKFLFVAFIGIHIPLIGLILYLAFGGNEVLDPISVFIAVLIFTLAATGVTLFILNKLLEPIIFAKESLSEYIVNKKAPQLPTNYTDEVGILLKEIQFSIQTLDELLEEKQDMIGLMSHDLKNPLAAVITYSELIPSADTIEKKQSLSEKIKSAAEVQRDIINAVLELLEREEIVITSAMMSEIQLEKMFDSLKSNHEESLTQKNLTLNIDSNNLNILAREDLIRQVFSNLINNAVKFTPNGGTISITASKNDKNTEITVTDNGIGFPPNKSKAIFERFTKEKRKGTQGENTTGLGLYLCNKIVSRHSGKIVASSKGEGLGSTFIVTLPN
jgi:signal transduction histidine kinase